VGKGIKYHSTFSVRGDAAGKGSRHHEPRVPGRVDADEQERRDLDLRLVHGDLFNVPRIRLPGEQLQIKFSKSKSDFYVLSTKVGTWAIFRFLDATLHVTHVKPSLTIQLAQTKALEKVNARYDITRAVLKAFTFGAGSKSV
jgi:hypothetical protein